MRGSERRSRAARRGRLVERGGESLPRVVAPLDRLHLGGIGSRERRLVHLELGRAHRGVAQPLADTEIRRLVVLPLREAVTARELAELLLECLERPARPDVGGGIAAHVLEVTLPLAAPHAGARAALRGARAALRGARAAVRRSGARGGAIRRALRAGRARRQRGGNRAADE